MSKTITISDETWGKIKDQVNQEEDNIKEKKKIGITIKNRFTGEIIFESEKITYKEAVEEAVNRDAYLEGANLGGADLRGADLRDAYLRGAYLGGADLGGADLRDAYLRGAYLGGADLGGADLRDADLEGANLGGADLRGADFYKTLFYGRRGTTKINKDQIDDFLKALGIIVTD